MKTTVDVTKGSHPHISIASLPPLNTKEGFGNLIPAVSLDVISDWVKAAMVKGVAPVWARAMGSMRQSGSAVGRWVAANRMTLDTFSQISTGTVFKVNKDKAKDRMTKRYEKLGEHNENKPASK